MNGLQLRALPTCARIVLVLLPLAACTTAAEIQANARAVAAQDDATCRSYGASPGSAVYVQCRMNISNQRAAAERQEDANQAALGSAWLMRQK
jgi:hypothetical protein